MTTRNAIFHTATVEYGVPGPAAEVSAVAYNLQYTTPLVDSLLEGNEPLRSEENVIRLHDRELTRVTLFGSHPHEADRAVATIGIGDDGRRAALAARRAWFNFHASALFTDLLERHHHHSLEVRRRVPGLPVAGADTVGVAYELDYLKPAVDAALQRNQPTSDEVHVISTADLTLMRADIHGRHPLDADRTICVAGVADRHYRAIAAAEQAWRNFHTTLLFAARALGAV